MKFSPDTPISQIKPYDRNPRQITKDATNAVAASIDEFGFLNPIVIDQDGIILAGHNRFLAAKQLGLQTVPTIQTTISELKAKGYRIASNRAGEVAQWDRDLLDKEIAGIMQQCDGLIQSMSISDWEVKRAMAAAEAASSSSTKTKQKTAAPSIPSKPIEGIPQIIRTVLIVDKPADTPALLAMLGYENAADLPAQMHASEVFRDV